MQPDPSPMGIAMADPQSWNLYSYVRNRPTRSVDVGGNWATDVHAEIVTFALTGYLSAGELAVIVHRQYVMDADQSPSGQYKHAMRNGTSQSSPEATKLMWNFVASNLDEAKADKLGDRFTDLGLIRLGDAIHTVEDYTSPEHVSAGGELLPWSGVGFLGLRGMAHWGGESAPNRDWAAIGTAVRLTMAAYMQANPEQAAQHGLTEATFDNQANQRISQLVEWFYSQPVNSNINSEAQRDAARQCALGNPAACGL